MFKNAFLSIKKSIGKTILLFIIMGVIANLVIAGLAIRNATEKSMEQIRASLGNDVTLSVDMRSLMGNRDKGQAFNIVWREFSHLYRWRDESLFLVLNI